MKTNTKGICHICGNELPLTKEHTPPKYAGNVGPVSSIGVLNILQYNRVDLRRITHQNGLHFLSLCEGCNKATARDYNEAFSKFCRDGIAALRVSHRRISPLIEIYPLRIIKQLYVIFSSISSPEWVDSIPGLKDYLLDRLTDKMEPSHRIYIYFLKGNIGRRFSGLLIPQCDNVPHHVAEFSFPPFGFILTVDDFRPDSRFTEITFFKGYGYEDRMNFALNLNELPNPSKRPLDYGDDKYGYGFLYGSDLSMHQKIQT